MIRNLGRLSFLGSKIWDSESAFLLFLLDYLLQGGSGEYMINT